MGWPLEDGEPPHWVSLFTLKCRTRVTLFWLEISGWGWKAGKQRSFWPTYCSFGVRSCQVTSQDKAPSVISRVLKKNNRDSAVASEYELVQLLPGERGQGQTWKENGAHQWEFCIQVVVGGMLCLCLTPPL